MKKGTARTRPVVWLLLVLAVLGGTWLLFSHPARQSAAEAASELEAVQGRERVLTARLQEYKNGSEALDQTKAWLAAAEGLLPTVDTSSLAIEQYMKLNLPVKIQSALQQAGFAEVVLGRFEPHVPADLPPALAAMSFQVSVAGTPSQLSRAIEVLRTDGVTAVVLKATLGLPSAEAVQVCETSVTSECLVQDLQIVVFMPRPAKAS